MDYIKSLSYLFLYTIQDLFPGEFRPQLINFTYLWAKLMSACMVQCNTTISLADSKSTKD